MFVEEYGEYVEIWSTPAFGFLGGKMLKRIPLEEFSIDSLEKFAKGKKISPMICLFFRLNGNIITSNDIRVDQIQKLYLEYQNSKRE